MVFSEQLGELGLKRAGAIPRNVRMRPSYFIPRLLFAALWVVTACFGCAGDKLDAPRASILRNNPKQVSIEKLRSDFAQDVTSAKATYCDNRYYFQSILVETIKRASNPDPDSYIISNGIMFKPRYSNDLDNVAVGSLVDVIGEVQGELPVIVVVDCWIKVVGGETAITRSGY